MQVCQRRAHNDGISLTMESSYDFAARYEFERFLGQILQRTETVEVTTTPTDRSSDGGFDFIAIRDGRPLVIRANATTPQTSYRLEQAAAALLDAVRHYRELHLDQDPVPVLAFPGVVSRSKANLVASAGLEVWDGPYLRRHAWQLDVPVPPFIAHEHTSGLDYDRSGGPQAPESSYSYPLLDRLNSIRPGQRGWSAYERYCEDLLNFLFVPPLNLAIPQSRDDRHANQRDYILPNYAMDGGFWHFMRTHYEAHYIVAEVKNLTSGPGKREILQVANYLNPHGTGLFALILARKELDQTARWICREQWIQHRKLIVGIHDDDIYQMVETKLAGDDPAELLRQKIEDFRLRI